MGELDRDLCNFWKEVASTNTTLATPSIIKFEFHESQQDFYIGLPFYSIWISLPTPSLLYSLSSLFALHYPAFILGCLIPVLPVTRNWIDL